MNKLIETKQKIYDEIEECEYWLEVANKDLREMNFSSFSSYSGCKIVIEKNEKRKKELEEKWEALDKAHEIIIEYEKEEKDD